MTVDAVVDTPHQVAYREYRLEFPAEADSVFVVRANVRAMCAVWRVPQETTDVVLLLASEITTNAVAVSGGEVLRMTLRRVLGLLYFDCNDYDPAIPTTPAMPDAEEPSGRGLALVEALASTWGWKWPPQEQGKVCWFTLAVR